MSLNQEISNIAEVPFVAMALNVQEQINRSYLRKMNKDYAAHISPAHIPNLYEASESHLSEIQFRESPNQEKRNE
jgi:hypothetical protein